MSFLVWTTARADLRALDCEAWPLIQSQMIDAMVRVEWCYNLYLYHFVPLPRREDHHKINGIILPKTGALKFESHVTVIVNLSQE